MDIFHSRRQALPILYDLALHISGQAAVGPLLLQVLRRFIHHTSFHCAAAFLFPDSGEAQWTDDDRVQVTLAQAIGDHLLLPRSGAIVEVPAPLVLGPAELTSTGHLLRGLPFRQNYYRSLLRLPIPELGAVILLSKQVRNPPDVRLFEPLQENLSREIRRCRDYEGHIAELSRTKARLGELHEELIQSEKMASIGQLAAGIAHEINNPMAYLKSNVEQLDGYVRQLITRFDASECGRRMHSDPEYDYLRQDVQKLTSELRQGVERVQNIVHDLKEFSHVDQSEWAPADLRLGIESTLNLIRNEVKYKAEIVRDYGELPQVECIARQLNQVFLNVLVNAAQAIPDRGTITVRTRTEGQWAVVEIADTGIGIPPDKVDHIFEPFFTTKPVGQGTGLGLPIAKRIVQRHGGKMEVESQAGQGTTFRIKVPVRALEAGPID